MSHSAETVRTFPQLLSELEDGAFAAELTGQMAKLVAELRERVGSGDTTLEEMFLAIVAEDAAVA